MIPRCLQGFGMAPIKGMEAQSAATGRLVNELLTRVMCDVKGINMIACRCQLSATVWLR